MKRLLLEGALFFALRTAPAAASFIVLGLGAHSLNDREFALMAALASANGLAGMFDFGTGLTAQYLASESSRTLHVAIFRAAGVRIVLIELFLVPAVAGIAYVVPEHGLVAAGLSPLLLVIPLSMVDRFRAVRQEIRVSAGFSGCAAAITVVISLLFSKCTHPELMMLVVPWSAVVAYGVHIILVHLSASEVERLERFPFTGTVWRGPSFGFFAMQVSSAIVFQTDILFLLLIVSGEESSGYLVTFRLMSAGAALLGSFVQALWPHIAASDSTQVVRDFRSSERLLLALTGAVLFGTALAFLGVFDELSQAAFGVQAPTATQLGLVGIFWCAFVSADGYHQLAIGLGGMRRQTVCAVVNAGGKLVLSPMMMLIFNAGVSIMVSSLLLFVTHTVTTVGWTRRRVLLLADSVR